MSDEHLAQFLQALVDLDSDAAKVATFVWLRYVSEGKRRPLMKVVDVMTGTRLTKRRTQAAIKTAVAARMVERQKVDSSGRGGELWRPVFDKEDPMHEELPPIRAGPETKKKPTHEGPAPIGRHGDVSTLPAEPADQNNDEPSTPSTKRNRIYP